MKSAREEGAAVRGSGPYDASPELRFRSIVPAHPVSVAYVRHGVQSLTDLCGEERTSDLGLIFSELVTNVIRHARLDPTDEIEVTLALRGGVVSGSVTDGGPGFDASAMGPKPARGGGFGLFIVDRLTRRWGVETTSRGNRVWFEL